MKRSLLPALFAALGAALIGLLAYGLSTHASGSSLDEAVARGQRPAAPDRRLPVLGDSATRSLADYRGRVVVLNFWASWCVPCAAEAPMLERAQRSLVRYRATVLGVTFRDTTPDSLSFVRRYRITYPSLRDVDGQLAQAYGTVALPESFVLDRQGRLAAISRGEIGPAFLRRAQALAASS